MVVKVTKDNLTDILKKAIGILNKGGIIAYPTETFYGIGARFDIENALKRIYELKKRPEEKPMPLIIGDRKMLLMISVPINNTVSALMDKFWPGPLTLLLRAKKELSQYLTAGTANIAVRIPGESIALQLAIMMGFPITATSANLSGMPPAEDAETVLKYFGNTIDLIIDGGKTPGGFSSTIIDVTGEKIKIVREGAIPISALKDF
ncbi:MAG: threonylcarbamoyl-AMP synthase [Nitrospirae bacterium]|nr:threonylcarbamoyl-AMP synthase [Nitrospirota bacterium]